MSKSDENVNATILLLDDKTANAGSKNCTKYARDLAKISYFNGNKQGAAWCAVFVAWCFVQAYGKAAALKLLCQPSSGNCGAGCKYILRYFRAKGQWHTSNPQPGDVVVFFDSTKSSYAHTGLVYKVTGSKVYTVEGNTSGASGVIANGGGVCKKSYSISYGRIAGYGRPAWGTETASGAHAEKDGQQSSQTTGAATAGESGGAGYTLYTIQKGDTLWGIAKKFLGAGSRYKEIKELNGLTSNGIKAGRTLKIPNA